MHRSILGVVLLAAAAEVAADGTAGAAPGAAGARAAAEVPRVVTGDVIAMATADVVGVAAADVVGAATSGERPGCPPAGATVFERYLSADCPDCWSTPSAPQPPAGAWLFDWIVPGATADAPLSAAASAEARERALRGGRAPAGQQALERRARLPASPGFGLALRWGPAWHGYVGAELAFSGRAPKGATGWLALVEALPPGSEGNAVRRELVRTVAGPLSLANGHRGGEPTVHWHALRIPEMADVERLRARGWVEAPDGGMLAVASEGCPAAGGTASRR